MFFVCDGKPVALTLLCLLTLPYLVPVVDIDARAMGEDVVEYVYPVKKERWCQLLWEELILQNGTKEHFEDNLVSIIKKMFRIETLGKNLWKSEIGFQLCGRRFC